MRVLGVWAGLLASFSVFGQTLTCETDLVSSFFETRLERLLESPEYRMYGPEAFARLNAALDRSAELWRDQVAYASEQTRGNSKARVTQETFEAVESVVQSLSAVDHNGFRLGDTLSSEALWVVLDGRKDLISHLTSRHVESLPGRGKRQRETRRYTFIEDLKDLIFTHRRDAILVLRHPSQKLEAIVEFLNQEATLGAISPFSPERKREVAFLLSDRAILLSYGPYLRQTYLAALEMGDVFSMLDAPRLPQKSYSGDGRLPQPRRRSDRTKARQRRAALAAAKKGLDLFGINE